MKSLVIFIVEDEFIIAANLKAMLEEMGYVVLDPVGSLNAAIKKLNEDMFDFAILDLANGVNLILQFVH